eukprot:COSAG06_NODE_3424_length_5365_cov_15.833080_3_plen_109_part_00
MTIRQMRQDSFAIACMAGKDYNSTGTRASPDHGFTHTAFDLYVDEFTLVGAFIFEFSLCLSRACLGKKIVFIYKLLKKGNGNIHRALVSFAPRVFPELVLGNHRVLFT